MKIRKDIKNPQCQNEKQVFKTLESLRNSEEGLITPEGYFDTLSVNISDRIHLKNPSTVQVIISILKKKVVFIPVSAVATVIIALVILLPAEKKVPVVGENELSQIALAYDASYAEEAYFSESCLIENELNHMDLAANASNIMQPEEATATEIIEYLGNQEIDPELLSNYK